MSAPVRRNRRWTTLAAFAWCVAVQAGPALAQTPTLSAAQEAILDATWNALSSGRRLDVKTATEAQLHDLILEWSRHPDVRAVFEDEALQQLVIDQRAEVVEDESLLARSTNAASTNPRSVGLVERSGLVDLVALAFEGTNLVAADDTAVTLNLNAAAFVGPKTKDPRASAAALYRYQSGWSRLGGSVTFGAKLPEDEITGFSGFPDREHLFDAVSWDVKFRVFGDRDIRAQHWNDELFYLGSINVAHKYGVGVPAFDSALRKVATSGTRDLVARIRRTWQGSVKLSGQHLSNVEGMDKYTAVAMLDGGLGPFDVTLNGSYSATRDVTADSASPYTLKQWRAAAGLSGTVLKGKIVRERGTVVTLSGEGLFPNDGADVPIERKRTWRGDLAARFPVSDTLSVPVSVTFTNDPNNLTKQKYAKGQIGINYDFGALKTLLGK